MWKWRNWGKRNLIRMAKVQKISEISPNIPFTEYDFCDFLMMYTKLSAPMLMEQLNANIHYQIFCGIRINPMKPLTMYSCNREVAH